MKTKKKKLGHHIKATHQHYNQKDVNHIKLMPQIIKLAIEN